LLPVGKGEDVLNICPLPFMSSELSIVLLPLSPFHLSATTIKWNQKTGNILYRRGYREKAYRVT
jgi:hypothetical protein